MSCDRYAPEAVHLVLGQGDQRLLGEFHRHRARCAECDREASEIESLLGLMRRAAEQPASFRFRELLQLRLLEEQRIEDERLLEDSSFADRVVCLFAYTRFRVRGSTALKALLTTAALSLVSLSIYLAWNVGHDRSVTGERPTAGLPAVPPDLEQTVPESLATADQGDSLVALEQLEPPRPRDVIIEPPPFPLPLPEEPEQEYSLETVREARALTLRENLFAQARFRMRHRFSRPGNRPVDRAVLRSLRYLSGAQEPDGSWDPEALGGQAEARHCAYWPFWSMRSAASPAACIDSMWIWA